MIQVNQVEMTYGKGPNSFNALNKITFSIQKGEFVAIEGKSGCGKSTLLNVLGGICHPTSGDYIFEDINVSSLKTASLARFRNEHIGFVVQHFALIPDMTIYQNVELPLVYRKSAIKDRNCKINDVMDRLGIRNQAHKKPTELSGGEKQRVAIARAIVGTPSLLLADEPTGALDEQTGNEVFELLRELNQNNVTIVLVTHDLDMAKKCDRIITMKDGKIVV